MDAGTDNNSLQATAVRDAATGATDSSSVSLHRQAQRGLSAQNNLYRMTKCLDKAGFIRGQESMLPRMPKRCV